MEFESYVKGMFKKFDDDGSGKIEFREFIEIYRKIFIDKAQPYPSSLTLTMTLYLQSKRLSVRNMSRRSRIST